MILIITFLPVNGAEGVGLRVRLGPSEQAVGKAPVTGQPDDMVSQPATGPATKNTLVNPWKAWICTYSGKLDKPDWALAHRAYGVGDVYACQIPLTGRIDSTQATEFDPVAERLLAFMIEGESLRTVTPAK